MEGEPHPRCLCPPGGQTSRSFALVSEGAHGLAGRVLHRAGIATPHLLPAASGLPVLALGKVVQLPQGLCIP